MTAYRLWSRGDAGDFPSRDPGRYSRALEGARTREQSREMLWGTWGKRAEDGAGLPSGDRLGKQGRRTALGSHPGETAERGQGGSWLSDPERPGERV